MTADRYAPEPESARLVRVLGPITLVYHRRSGITHLLTEPAPQILEALDATGPADAEAIAGYLAERFDLASDDGVELVVAARLEELATLGLVRVERQ